MGQGENRHPETLVLQAHKGLLLEIFPPVAFARQGIAWLLLEISLPYRLLATA